jgi:ABC-2 type transport system permease protein
LLLVFIFATMFHNTSQNTGHPMIFALPLGLAYAMIGFTQLFYNHLGAEGPGIQLLFLSPTPIRTVFLAKNLFHSMIFGIDAVVVCTLVSLRMGMPQPAMLAATLAWLLFALPTHLAAGNIFSILFPYRVNPGRISRQRGSQGNALLSLLIQAVVLGAGAGVFALCSIGDRLWLAVPIFLVLAGGAFFAWSRVLQNADAMANRHKESLMETVMKTA